MRERIRQIGQAWGQLMQVDPAARWWIFGAVVLGVAVGVVAGWLVGWWWGLPMALLLGALAGLLVFGRRMQRAQFAALDGQLGAAAAVLNQLRGQWFVTPAVSYNKQQDMVHRAIGRCGIVLVGEGSRQRVKGLLAKERKRYARVFKDVPVHTVVVGDGEDEVELKRLQAELTRLPRKLSKTEPPRLERKMAALDQGPGIPGGVDPNAARRGRPRPR